MEVLKLLAGSMWKEVAEGGRKVVQLSGGLRVAVRVDGNCRQLGLSRGADEVDYHEAGICRAAFGVPTHTRPDITALAGQRWKIYTWYVQPAAQLDMFGQAGE